MWLKPNSPAGEWPIALAAISAFGLVRSQAANRPFLQNQQSPQLIVNGTTTRSPILRLVTSDPSATTSPMFSWPRMSPASMVGW
ncbi:hypothetical protein WR25_27236 [Diploscapter pachys]|uniref:Uncharacterized protein n=1 Tax=Diploscapter pachys TaxID=2018661 RepID=A0A2A2M5S9_9BILA|nr:hypothetical protein WR25_27236 [Diploscapter pachys]